MASIITKFPLLKYSKVNLRSFSSTLFLKSLYPEDVLKPMPYPILYWGKFDPIKATSDFRPAPSTNTYSNFFNQSVHELERKFLKKGKGYIAEDLMNQILENLKLNQVTKYHESSEEEKQEIELNPIVVLNAAIENIKPKIGLQSYRKGSQSYRVPYPLSDRKQQYWALKWMIDSTRGRKKKGRFVDRMSAEILAAYNFKGEAMKRKQAQHLLADANRAYAHLRWTPTKQPAKLRGRKAAKAKRSRFSR